MEKKLKKKKKKKTFNIYSCINQYNNFTTIIIFIKLCHLILIGWVHLSKKFN